MDALDTRVGLRRRLLRQIVQGEYGQGQYLPPIRRLASTYQVSATRVYRIINDLCRSKVLTARHGDGVMVSDPSKAIELLGAIGTKYVAFTIPAWIRDGISNPHYGEILKGAEEAARQRGYRILYATVELDELPAKPSARASGEEDLPSPSAGFFHEREIEGILLVGPMPQKYVERFLAAHSSPTVCVDNAPEMDGLACVTSSNLYGAIRATDYLISKGHRRIGFVTVHRSLLCVDERRAGFLAAMHKHHLEDQIAFVKETEPFQCTFDGGYEFAGRLVSDGSIAKATAVIAANDQVAAGLLKGFADGGLKPPDDISVMGFGDDPVGRIVEPPLTTMQVQSYKMGQIAVETLLDILHLQRKQTNLILLPMQLVARESVADCNGK